MTKKALNIKMPDFFKGSNQSPKKNRKKKKTDPVTIWAIIVSSVVAIALICGIVGLIVMAQMLKDKPTLSVNDFESPESSIIYDVDGNVVAELGQTIRENITYDDLPTTLIDAFVAVEDSRFFEHIGFDVPRFTKAILENLRTLSFGQGGSTFTMQLVKNTYFVDDEAGVNAPKKISRKVQEIALAIDLEREVSKEVIFENYLNKLNFGGNRNIRGVEKAAQYYFGKSVKDLNLAESALLAGVINAPNAYNPFRNLALATSRRNEVLYLMNYHGYISDEEYLLAKSIKVEDLLRDPNISTSGNGNGIPYQAYVDVVVSEIFELTGLDPYTTTMKIYTYMDKDVQELMDAIQSGNTEDLPNPFEYPDDEFELASISINNKTGAINGVLGGRNYAGGGALLLNHATDQFKQPGSSIKPIIDYALAFEKLGWATSHVLEDKPITYSGTNLIISNSDGNYRGQVTLTEALGRSLNTTAIQTLEQVISATSNSYVIEYMKTMGFDIEPSSFNTQFGIGGSDLTVSCEQMAAAQGALMNYGSYTKPHTISRIEFTNGKEPVVPVYTSINTISEQAAFLTTELLYSNVYGEIGNMMQILKDNYAIYAKTGTTDWGISGRPYNIPDGSIKDGWMIASTSEYTVATWIGYERAYVDKQSYIKLNVYTSNIQGKVTNMISDKNVEVHGTPEKLKRPDGITSITHIIGTFPYVNPIDGMDPKYITTGLIATKNATLVNAESVSIDNISGTVEMDIDVNNLMTITIPKYPNEEKTQVADEEYDISLRRSDGTAIIEKKGKRLFDYSWVTGKVVYAADIYNNDEFVQTITSNTNVIARALNVKPGDKIKAVVYYKYDKIDKASNKVTTEVKEIPDVIVNFQTPKANATIAEINKWANVVKINLVDIKEVTDSAKAGTYSMEDSDGNKYAPDTTHSMMSKELAELEFRVEVYVSPVEKPVITERSNNPEPTPGSELTFVSTVNGVSWNLSNYSIASFVEENEEEGWITVKISESASTDDKFTITASKGTQKDSIEITVK